MGRGGDGDIRGPTARAPAAGSPRGKDVGVAETLPPARQGLWRSQLLGRGAPCPVCLLGSSSSKLCV